VHLISINLILVHLKLFSHAHFDFRELPLLQLAHLLRQVLLLLAHVNFFLHLLNLCFQLANFVLARQLFEQMLVCLGSQLSE